MKQFNLEIAETEDFCAAGRSRVFAGIFGFEAPHFVTRSEQDGVELDRLQMRRNGTAPETFLSALHGDNTDIATLQLKPYVGYDGLVQRIGNGNMGVAPAPTPVFPM